MSFIESAMCAFREYEALENDRLLVHELNVDEIYTIMYALKNRLAAKIPAKVKSLNQNYLGLQRVGLSHINTELKETLKVLTYFDSNNYMRAGLSSPYYTIKYNEHRHKIITAYIRPIGDMVPDDLSAIKTHVYIPDRQELSLK